MPSLKRCPRQTGVLLSCPYHYLMLAFPFSFFFLFLRIYTFLFVLALGWDFQKKTIIPFPESEQTCTHTVSVLLKMEGIQQLFAIITLAVQDSNEVFQNSNCSMLCNTSFWQTREQDNIKLSEKLKTFSTLLNSIDKAVSKADIYGNEGEEDKGKDQWSLLKPCASSS